MMYLINIPVILPEGRQLHASFGSIFHGWLMEHIAPEEAVLLHQQQVRPYRQSLLCRANGMNNWQFGLLTEHMYHTVMHALAGEQKIYLRQKGYAVSLGKPVFKRTETYEDLMNKHLAGQVAKTVRITFCTTTSFKQQGNYVILPNSQLVYQNLLLRWNTFSPEPLEEGIADILSYYTKLTAYHVQSRPFGVERRNIYGCTGYFTYQLGGEEMVQRTAALLLDFANFAGIGIKTALGMGAVDVQFQ